MPHDVRDRLTCGALRRRRRMHRLLRELDRLDAGVPRRDRAGSRGRRGRMLLVTSVTTVLVVAFAAAVLPEFGVTLTRHGLVRSAPLGRPPTVAEGPGKYAFTNHQPGRPGVPVAYDPCRLIHVEVNDDLAPPGGAHAVRSAIAAISAATGLQFHLDGPTERVPPRTEDPRGPAWPAFEWDPVLIAWTTPDQVPGLAGRVAGLAGSQMVERPTDNQRHYVTGSVALDAATLAETMQLPGGPRLVRAVVLHELGHLVGLDHVADPDQLMNDENLGLTDFGNGDRQGLAQLGRGRCLS